VNVKLQITHEQMLLNMFYHTFVTGFQILAKQTVQPNCFLCIICAMFNSSQRTSN